MFRTDQKRPWDPVVVEALPDNLAALAAGNPVKEARMLPGESTRHSDLWDLLQQPARPAGGIEPRYRLLLAALDIGWQIEEPVYLRPRWSETGPRVYHFILRRAPLDSPYLLSVPEAPEVERLVHEAGLQVSVSK